jgi:purine-binding chemotaxis protein CheW
VIAALDVATAVEVVTFRVGNQWFGVPVLDVQEVITHQRVARVPLAREGIAGLLNLRGQIVTAIDMHRQLEISSDVAESLMNVVVCDREELFALVVDEVGDVAAFSPQSVEQLPANLDGAWARVCTGLVQLDQGLLALIDVTRLLDESNTRP